MYFLLATSFHTLAKFKGVVAYINARNNNTCGIPSLLDWVH